MASAKMGIFYEVNNTKRKNGENEKYMAIKVEDESGCNERWLMFTEREWLKLPSIDVSKTGAEQLKLKKGRLYECIKNGIYQFVMNTGNGCITLITKNKLAKAEARAKRNQEDQPEQSWLADSLD